MTAIVGPNGCGKSNVADAVRWVLGETSAKALRGSKMEDVIFNGTDQRKPVGMAEVNIAFADCEGTLGTEYNEVTVTRRVFRSGEGQYFLNKTACRLKDIQRLFMDTGIGTSSYSLMEQGRIDLILSSRPEDRREIFEEASGITRFKSDRKEALRKLEQTEANLLRLDDVIREVKRQIGSLQRQAGKARRYKELREQLRKLDTFWSAGRLQQMDRHLQTVARTLEELGLKIRSLHEEIETAEGNDTRLRQAVQEIEDSLGQTTEERAAAQTRLDQNRSLIKINGERIEELRQLAERDRRDSALAKSQAEQQRRALGDLVTNLKQAETGRERAEQEWKARNDALDKHEQHIEQARRQIQELRNGAMALDHAIAQFQNQLTQLESQQQATLARRERLSAEHAQIARLANDNESHLGQIAEHLGSLQGELRRREERASALEAQRHAAATAVEDSKRTCSELQSQLAVKKAQTEILEADDTGAKDFPEGARLLLDGANPLGANAKNVLGALASHIQVEPPYRTALEAVLRAWLDAVVVSDSPSALRILKELHQRKAGAARILAAESAAAPLPSLPAPDGARRFVDLVTCTEAVGPVVRRLLANVILVPSLDGLPGSSSDPAVYVTREGLVLRPDGAFEYWTSDARGSNPFSRRHQLADLREATASIQADLTTRSAEMKRLQSEMETLLSDLRQAGTQLTEQRRAVALKEGEYQIVAQEVRQAKERLGVVGFEIEEIKKHVASDEERQAIAKQIDEARSKQADSHVRLETLTHALQDMERRRSGLQAEATEARVKFAEVRQQAEHFAAQEQPLKARLEELEGVIKSRSEGLVQYEKSMMQLSEATTQAEGQMAGIEAALAACTEKLDSLRKERSEKTKQLAILESDVTGKRGALEELREQKSRAEIKHAEDKMHRQNLVDRVTGEWAATLDDIMKAPVPEWEGEKPTEGEPPWEAAIAELRAKIEAMGPVNLVAIEEYQELEERYAFLTGQQTDLLNAKQQLMDMIKKINQTTADLFTTTFARINENFQTMYERLFNGGSAKLVMVAADDVLESGIDIIARPPGKRLQSVSLLSGGERTMTAVALLFAIYMIKPSPFCMLDELDAALDESNIGRFVNVLADFLKQSQFIVITHNRRTIAAANTIYGVTMQETGISKVVSMKFSEYEQSKDFQQNGTKKAQPAPA